jgi:membrane-associated protein
MFSLISAIFNNHVLEQLLKQDLLTGWFLIGVVVYLETALVFMLFLPVDSLLLTAGAFVASQHASLALPLVIFSVAAWLGDTTAFSLVHNRLGRRLAGEKWVAPGKLERTRHFFKRYGVLTVIAGRFVGFVRSVTPLAAGLSRMPALRYLSVDTIGCVAWAFSLLKIGDGLGKIYWVQLHLTGLTLTLVLGTLLVCLTQAAMVYLGRRNKRNRPV